MRRGLVLAAALAAAALPGAAEAINCYAVLDRSNSTIYQDTQPPFDLSEAGRPARDAMRARGEFLTISDADRCPLIAAPPGVTGYQPASVDDIVAGIRPYGSGAVSTTSAAAAGGRGNARPAAPATSTRSSSSGMRTY
ncbi:MAG TPA: hypothetical protein VMN79_02005 [Casimicrobiaceae bacterium]|nr:hypothetical protein [Casimicrobiaceae bacterium]